LIATAALALLSGVRDSIGRAAIGACFVAMVVHSLAYAAFATDPATWALLGVGVALRRGQRVTAEESRSARESAPAESPAAPATIPG
jgi:hypothetical protein